MQRETLVRSGLAVMPDAENSFVTEAASGIVEVAVSSAFSDAGPE